MSMRSRNLARHCPSAKDSVPSRFTRRLLAGAAFLSVSLGAQAISFSEALDAARSHDATYRAASYEYDAARMGVPIARASLLPSVSLNAGESNITGSRRFPNGQNQEVRLPLDYSAPQAALQMRMPLFNFEAISAFRQAQAQVDVAEAVFRSQGMDLMDRLVSAYLQTLLADEGKRLVESQIKSYELQVLQTEQRLQRGEGTRVQLAQARAVLDVARTRLLEAEDQIGLARIRLERLTGVSNAIANALLPLSAAEPLFPSRLTDWLDLALRQSPTVQSRERNREVARQVINRQRAGHLPRVDLVASLSRSENDASNTVGQSTVLRSVGVQFSMPLFSGGGVSAGVQQAQSRSAQAEEELRSERDNVEIEVQRHFQATINGEKKVAAYVKALESTDLAARGALRALETGIGTLGELADAESIRFNAARDLVQARVDVLLSRARLMMRAGMQLGEVASGVDRSLGNAPPSGHASGVVSKLPDSGVKLPAATATPVSPPSVKP